jgi:orotidine-5'-phosphate decarboxylase
MKQKYFIALDNMDIDGINVFLSSYKIQNIKIGLEQFLKYGPDLITDLNRRYGVQVFLDLKLHDIPNTVYNAIKALKGLPITFLTVHISGGKNMLESAIKAGQLYLPNCKILGVSILTSLEQNDLDELFNIDLNQSTFDRLFKLANDVKLSGVICSPLELKILKSKHPNLLAICPGIRFEEEIIQGMNIGDQKRVLNPKAAFIEGADYLVIGRSLTAIDDNKLIKKRLSFLNQINT